jgi:heat shock protein HtpX
MPIIWLQTSKTQNNLRVVFLISLLPLLVFLCLLIFYTMTNKWIAFQESIYMSWITVLYSSPLILLWLIIWITIQKKLIFGFTWAREIQRTDNPEIYNIVENLCISRGLPIPKIWIIDDDSMNAFATWWSPKNSYIVFSKWLIEKLDKREIEAVAWHELTHIMNWDVKTMVITNVFIWIIWTIWYILMRTRWKKNPLPLLWLFLYLLSLILLPLINLAISRKKEFLADAWSVELTKDKDSMIKALQKISTDARIEYIDW